MDAGAIGNRKNIINKRRKGALSVAVPWLRRFGIAALAAILILALAIWFCFMNGAAAFSGFARTEILNASANMGFKVENIMVEGRVHSSASALKDLLNENKGAALFAFDPDAAREKLEKMDWVKSAQVERRLPDTIYVKITEHAPIVLWQTNKTLRLIGEDGAVINESQLAPFGALMIVIGEGAPAQAPQLLASLSSEPSIQKLVTSARWMDGRRWDLITKDGLTIKMPEGDMDSALHRLARADREDKIFEKEISEIDMRQDGRLTLRTKPGALQEYKERQAAAKTEKAI